MSPHSYAPVLLARRAKKLRKETGDDTIQTEAERRRRPTSEIVNEALLRPFVLLATDPIMQCFSGYLAL